MAVETVVVPLEIVIVVMSVPLPGPRRACVQPYHNQGYMGTGERRKLPLTVYGLLTPLPAADVVAAIRAGGLVIRATVPVDFQLWPRSESD